MVALEGPVQAAHHPHGPLVICSHHNPVRLHEIIHRRPFLEELRIGHHAIGRGQAPGLEFFPNGGPHLVGGPHGHGGLIHDDLVIGHVLADIAGGSQHVLQIGGAVFVGRRTHGNELHGAVSHGLGHVGGKTQAACSHIAFHHIQQAGFKNGDTPFVQNADFVGIHIQAEHLIAHFRQTGTAHQAHIARTNYRNFQNTLPTQSDNFIPTPLPFSQGSKSNSSLRRGG